MNYYHYFAAASTYNCDAYGAGNYSENCATATQVTDSNPGGLADTGMPVLASIVGGVLLIAIGAFLLLKMLRNKKK